MTTTINNLEMLLEAKTHADKTHDTLRTIHSKTDDVMLSELVYDLLKQQAVIAQSLMRLISLEGMKKDK